MPGFGRLPPAPAGPPPGRGMPPGVGRGPPGAPWPPGRGAPCGRGPPPEPPGPPGAPCPLPGRGAPPGRGPPGDCGRGMPVLPDEVNGLLPGRGPAGRAPPGRGGRSPPGRGARSPRSGRPPPAPPSREPGPGRCAGRGPGVAAGRGAERSGAAGACSAAAGDAAAGEENSAAGAGCAGAGFGPGRGPGAGAGRAEVWPAAGVTGAAGGVAAAGFGAEAPGFGAAGRAVGPGVGADGLAGALRGAEGLAEAALPLPCCNASVNLRTTGASIVEDAERTNSPSSWSLAMTTLLSTPISLASSYTRTLATSLLLGPGWSSAGPSLLHGRTHRVLIECSSQSRPTSTREVPDRTVARAVPYVVSLLRCRVLHAPVQLRRPGRLLEPEGPGERPAADRQVEARHVGVQIRTPAGQRTARIGDALVTDHRDTQQILLGRSFPATHAGSLRACSGARPARHC